MNFIRRRRSRNLEGTPIATDAPLETGSSITISHRTYLHPRTLVEVRDPAGRPIARYSSDGTLRTPRLSAEAVPAGIDRASGLRKYHIVATGERAGRQPLATVRFDAVECAAPLPALEVRARAPWEFSLDLASGGSVAQLRVVAFVTQYTSDREIEVPSESVVAVFRDDLPLGFLVATLEASVLARSE